jgi:hypothetical protein
MRLPRAIRPVDRRTRRGDGTTPVRREPAGRAAPASGYGLISPSSSRRFSGPMVRLPSSIS